MLPNKDSNRPLLRVLIAGDNSRDVKLLVSVLERSGCRE